MDKTPKTATCNGDGGGTFGGGIGNEPALFWQHLSAAGLWPGIFRGGDLFTPPGWDNSTYAAVSVQPSVSWYATDDPTDAELAAPYSANILWFSAVEEDQLFTSSEASAFDKKYDDGAPATGNIQSPSGAYFGACADIDSSPTAIYDISRPGKICSPIFNNPGF